MSETTSDSCPRCGGGFHCGVGDAAPCACTTIRLDAATLAEMRARYATCLCMNCLAGLAAPKETGRPDLTPGRPG